MTSFRHPSSAKFLRWDSIVWLLRSASWLHRRCWLCSAAEHLISQKPIPWSSCQTGMKVTLRSEEVCSFFQPQNQQTVLIFVQFSNILPHSVVCSSAAALPKHLCFPQTLSANSFPQWYLVSQMFMNKSACLGFLQTCCKTDWNFEWFVWR